MTQEVKMSEEDLNLVENEEETPQDDLEGLSADLLEDKETPSQVIKIGEEEVPYDEVVQAYNDIKNNENWKKSNTEKAQELAEERRRLDQEKADYEQRRKDFETLEQGLYNKFQPPNNNQVQQEIKLPEDFEEYDPAVKALFQKIQGLETENRKFREC